MSDMSKSILGNDYCIINAETIEYVEKTYGRYYMKISKIDQYKLACDVLNPSKSIKQAELLSEYTKLNNMKVLEIGSGFGVNHIVWTKKYMIDGWGVEPNSEGFESSYEFSKKLIEQNGLSPQRIIDACGESLPFPDSYFDIVYSSNVLEHTQNPIKVIEEAIRVLKPGGVLQIIYPNYCSYYEGHYSVFMPPIFCKKFFSFYIDKICGRDPKYAHTLRSELNVGWTNQVLAEMKKKYDFEILSLGEDVFKERMKKANFEEWAGLYKLKKVIRFLQEIKLTQLAIKLVLLFKGFTPIIMTLRKNDNE